MKKRLRQFVAAKEGPAGEAWKDLRTIRKEAGKTLARCGKGLRCSSAFLSEVERGTRRLSVAVAKFYLEIKP